MAELAQLEPMVETRDRVRLSLPRWLAFPWKFLVGVAFIQSFVGAIAVMGWVWRLSQRFVLKAWWRQSKSVPWEQFLASTQAGAKHGSWPNWLLQQDFDLVNVKIRRLPRALFGSLLLNLKVGAQAIFNTWVITAPAAALWIFSWYDGWNNSFNKGYEQAAVGPLTGFAGVFLFIAAMFYLPLGQMRHAATGDWRAFYQFHLVWKLIRRRWHQCLGLAMVISALSLPVMIMKTAPGMFTAMGADKATPAENGVRRLSGGQLENLSPREALGKLKQYYFLCGLYLLPAIILARWVAARIYAGAVLDCVQRGAIAQEALHEKEWEALHRLNLLVVQPVRKRNRFIQLIAWFGTKAGAITIGFAMFLVYFSLVAQIYVGEFLHKNDRGQGWWNQPLVQLPYFNYIPARLAHEAKEDPSN